MAKAQCPVCKMEVETVKAKDTVKHGAAAYYFCCESHKNEFLRDPHKYLGEHAH